MQQDNMKIHINPEKRQWAEILKRPVMDVSALFVPVQSILDEIRQNGDRALRKYTLKFDGTELSNFSVTDAELLEAVNEVPEALKNAIKIAASNIEKFHASQKIG